MGWNPVCRCARAWDYSLPRAFRKMNTYYSSMAREESAPTT